MAGRPSKLTERQWAEIGRRVANKEPIRALAKEFGIDKTAISRRFSPQVKKLETLAKTIVEVEREFDALPISQQSCVIQFADNMKGIAQSASAGGKSGMVGAQRLLNVFERRCAMVTESTPIEDLRPIAALAETAQKGASLGLALLSSDKGKSGTDDKGGRSIVYLDAEDANL